MDLEIKRVKKKKVINALPRIRWGGVTPALSREIEEKLINLEAWSSGNNVNNVWDIIASCIIKVATEVLEVLRGTFGGWQGDWWWNDEVQG